MVALAWDGALTIVVLAIGLIVMMGDWLAPHLAFTAMVGVLMAATVIDTRAGASGFSNTGVLTVVVLYAVAEGVSQTGGLDRLMSRVLGTTATSGRAALIRMMLPVAVSSAFLNNTPIVALMIPILISWGRRCNVSPKLLLLPLSYASIFGGTTTLIGTSTNLVISGMQARRYAGTPDAVFNFFDITPYGVPYGVAGFVFTLLFGAWLLPKDTGSRPQEDLLLAAAVGPGSSVIGKALPTSGLLNLSGLRLLWVSRKGQLLFKAAAEEPRRHSKASRLKTALQGAAGVGLANRAPPKGPVQGPQGTTTPPASQSLHATTSKDLTVVIDVADGHDSSHTAPGELVLQEGDVLHFQGGIKRLQDEAQRLSMVLLTSELTSVEAAASAAAAGLRLPGAAAQAHSFKSGSSALTGGTASKPQASTGVGAWISRHAGSLGRLESSLVQRQATLGWSGATMWLFTARVRKGAPVIGRSIEDINFADYSVIVIGAELAGKKVPAARLGELVLGRGDLLVFTARNDFDYSSGPFAASFGQVELLRETKPKDFLLAVRVKAGAAGKDIATNGLQDIAGLFITAITRPSTHETFHDAGPSFELQLGDVLFFVTDLEGAKYLLKDARLEAVQMPDTKKLKGREIYRHLVQATVSPDSALIGHTARQARLRTYYEGVVVAIHRQSGDVSLTDVADVPLRAGDVLLLVADQSFKKRFQTNPAFGLVADVPNSSPLKTRLMWPALGLAAVMVLTQVITGFLPTLTLIDLWPAAILTAAAMLLIGCMNSDQAVNAIDWTVYITIAFAFGVSAAMERSKVAAAIASIFVTISKAIGGRTAALGSMYLVTGLLSEVLTNNAAAALMYPIAANVGDDMGIQPKIMSVAVMLGASAAFVSPFGYQCNLMVFTAGNYKTMDFVRMGAFLQVWQLVAACVILSLPNHWMVLCAISLAVVALTVAYAVATSLLAKRRARRAKVAATAMTAAA